MRLTDSYGRVIRDLRVSLTDRCNFRCFYCLPEAKASLAHRDKILTFEEICRLVKIFVRLGVDKIRLTGGEPLIRRDIVKLVEMIRRIEPGPADLALTTNGYDFGRFAKGLYEAGLNRVTISLDSLDKTRFAEITGVDALENVLEAVSIAQQTGLSPVKINVVVVRGRNDDEIVEFARFAREKMLAVRFIEYMPLDSSHCWRPELVVSGREIFSKINSVYPLTLKNIDRQSETAKRYAFADKTPGEIGIIAPVTEQFCGQCSRIRLTADGQLRTCLFSVVEHDLRSAMRAGESDQDLIRRIIRIVTMKEAGHSINSKDFVPPARSMSFIGG